MSSSVAVAECSEIHSDYYLATAFKWYYFCWFFLLANVIGIVLSGLCLIVLLRHPRVFAASTRAWFIALISTDFFILLIAANDVYAEIVFHPSYRWFCAMLFGGHTCQVRVSVIQGLLWSSNLLQAGLSIERLASVTSPLKVRPRTTGNITRLVIGTIFLLSGVVSVVITYLSFKTQSLDNFTVEHSVNQSTIANTTNHYYIQLTECNRRDFATADATPIDVTKIVYNIDLIVFRVIPLTTMLVSSAVIAALIRTKRIQRVKIIAAGGHLRRSSGSTSRNSRKFLVNGKENRACLLLIAMNVTTLLTSPLFILFELLDGATSEGREGAKLTESICLTWVLRHFFNSLLYFNNQTNWIFYIMFGARFRDHILNMCGLGRLVRRARPGTMSAIVDRGLRVKVQDETCRAELSCDANSRSVETIMINKPIDHTVITRSVGASRQSDR